MQILDEARGAVGHKSLLFYPHPKGFDPFLSPTLRNVPFFSKKCLSARFGKKWGGEGCGGGTGID